MFDSNGTIVDILILGAGWTADFLIPHLEQEHITYAATRRSLEPREKLQLATIPGCIKFDINADSNSSNGNDSNATRNGLEIDNVDDSQYTALPSARTVLVTFPLKPGQPARLVEAYRRSHPRAAQETQWIQLGSTGIYSQPGMSNSSSEYDRTDRSIAEDELRTEYGQTILCLAGLWGGSRQPRAWVSRVAGTKEKLAQKGSLHLVHGEDVARAVTAVYRHRHHNVCSGKRWIVTDGRVYDWWELIQSWSDEMPQQRLENGQVGQEPDYKRWLQELREMNGRNGRSVDLPRPLDQLGRWLDSSAFWSEMKLPPLRPLTERYESFPRL